MYRIRCQITMLQTKNYVDPCAFTTMCVVVSGNIKLSVDSELERSLGCKDLSAGKKVTLLLGTDTNLLTYSVPIQDYSAYQDQN